MGFCVKCGKELKKGTVFCSGCGARVSSNTSVNENRASNIKNSNSVKKESSIDLGEVGDKAKSIANKAIEKIKGFDYKGVIEKVKGFDYKNIGDKVKGLGSKLKGNNNGFNIKKGIAILVTVLILIGLAYNFTIGKTEYKILLGIKNIIEDKKAKYTYTLKVEGTTGIDEVDDLLEESSIEMKTYFNRKKLETNFEMALIVDKDEVVEANIGFEDETMFLEFPEVYDECFYQKVDSDQVDIIRDCINIYECFEGEIFDIFSKGDYKDVIVEMIDENLDKKVLILDIKDIIDLVGELLEIAEDDDKIAKDIYKSMEKIVKDLEDCKIKNDEIESFVDDFIDYFEDTDEDDFIDDFEDGIEMISNEFEKMPNLGVLGNYEVKVEFNFGMFNTIDKMDITFEVLGIDIIIGIECGKGASKPNYDKDLEIEDSEDELMEVLDEIEEDIMDNKKIEKLEDIDMYNFDDLTNYFY